MERLVTLVLALWGVISPGVPKLAHAREIAEAVASAVLAEPAPTYEDRDVDAAVMAYFAVRESWLDVRAVGDGGKAHGVWQLHGACGLRSVREQAACWVAMLREGRCREHPVAIMWGACSGPARYGRVEVLAAAREKRARALLAKVRAVEP